MQPWDGSNPKRDPGEPPHADETTRSAPSGVETSGGEKPSPDVGRQDLERQLREAEERVLRAQAELENYRKRSRREYEEGLRYRELDLLRDLLPVLDTIRRAIDASVSTTDLDGLRAGFRMTEQHLEKVLGEHGCTSIDADGKPFDPNVHEAILQQTIPGIAAGTVVGVARGGYRLHDRVVRPAQVIVAKGE